MDYRTQRTQTTSFDNMVILPRDLFIDLLRSLTGHPITHPSATVASQPIVQRPSEIGEENTSRDDPLGPTVEDEDDGWQETLFAMKPIGRDRKEDDPYPVTEQTEDS
jgi:hypothetical protein